MITVIGVRFRRAGKVYYFSPAGIDIKKGDNVIVETARGVEFGTVVLGWRRLHQICRRWKNMDSSSNYHETGMQ